MREISEEQQKELDELYEQYYTYLCKWYLRHPLDELSREWYHKKDFEENIEEESMHIKVSQGY